MDMRVPAETIQMLKLQTMISDSTRDQGDWGNLAPNGQFLARGWRSPE
jgi:hypothetical protein